MSIRPKRLAEVIKRDLGEILQKEYQPSGTFVTITKVVMTDDLSIAKVYLSIFAPNRDTTQLYENINENLVGIRHSLAGRIRNQVRKIPELHFYEDDTAEYVNKIENLFQKVNKQPKAPSDEKES